MNIPWGYSWEKALDEVKDTQVLQEWPLCFSKSEPIDVVLVFMTLIHQMKTANLNGEHGLK